ncbi:LytR/AlgR family response regulator transcription factor [Fibrella forsythiae]|uniref:LytTR family transcriptional regulator DNA-binding domain-containing protein n=1 Tax=Fibrella forsythiae TaxID=2817061 RepID=A0ABS3JF55_9BACT|nr:LytTR family DNA-binding domain-containing protein [Fibrella forsythiae]MBO0948620.1 LytTR family transcriptional regulator DNA-binding domain-containing protein [Fibrella forsythiae]
MKRVPYKRGEQTFEPENVAYLIGESNYSHVHQVDGEVILSCRNLKWFEDQWPAFVRLHKSALINVNSIAYYATGESNRVVMTDNAELIIARRRVPEVFSLLAAKGITKKEDELAYDDSSSYM